MRAKKGGCLRQSAFMMNVKALRRWFEEGKRELPWRENPSFYSVWVSEVMLQQTQAAVVIPYFERWMQKFPTIEALASASEDEVIKAWEGLGYYARARNLHAGAKEVVGREELLKNQSLLLKIKGLGPYTTGAIRSFAFHQRAAAVDGNVIRVVTRFFLVEGEVDKAQTRRTIEALVYSVLPWEESWVVMEALIELGARVCQKVPKCFECPLREGCRGYGAGMAPSLPNKRPRQGTIELRRDVTLLLWQGTLLVKKTAEGKVMAGLYEFPYYEEGTLEEHLAKLGVEATLMRRLKTEKQTFTRYRATLFPALYRVEKKGNPRDYEWKEVEALSKLPFSSGHRKIIKGEYAHFTY